MRARAAEQVLDTLLPIVPSGVHEAIEGEVAELQIVGADGPPPDEGTLLAAAGPHLLGLAWDEVPDDAAARRRAMWRPLVVASRFALRPEWAPAPAPELIDLVLDGGGFGSGAHPTTRMCLALLLELEPRGAFADLGCGSGVLAAAAARLGFAPVHALDRSAGAVAATLRTAERSGAAVEAGIADLKAVAPPAAGTMAANMPPAVHRAVAAQVAAQTRAIVVSGIRVREAVGVAELYGLRVDRALQEGGWAALLLRRA